MQSKANEIAPSQVFTFILSGEIGFGILSMASSLAAKVGHDGWISISISGIASIVLTYIIMLWLKRFKNLSVLEINVRLFGKVIGGFFNLVLLAYLITAAFITLRLFNDIIKISALKFTPPLVITSFIIIPTIYLSWYGLKYICRYASIIPAILIIVISYYLLLSKYFRLTFLQPMGAAGLMPILKNTYTPYVSFLGYELVPFIYPYLKDKKKSVKYAMYGTAGTAAFYVFTVIFLTGFFGEEMLKQLLYPIFSLARAYRAPVAERLDLFFIALWFPIMATSVQVYYFCSYNTLKKLLKIENNKPKCKILIWCLTVLVIALSRIPKDMIEMSKLLDMFGYIGSAVIAYMVLCYLLSFILPGGKKNETST